jgi:hypothetical protein
VGQPAPAGRRKASHGQAFPGTRISVARWHIFKPKIPNFGQFLEGLKVEDDVIFMTILSILRSNGIFYDHLVQFVVIWSIFPRFGMLF